MSGSFEERIARLEERERLLYGYGMRLLRIAQEQEEHEAQLDERERKARKVERLAEHRQQRSRASLAGIQPAGLATAATRDGRLARAGLLGGRRARAPSVYTYPDHVHVHVRAMWAHGCMLCSCVVWRCALRRTYL